MVSINYAFKEISCKIVYYGPGLSGKTTNLQYVHAKVPAHTKGELISLATDADRTLYFDFLPIDLGKIHNFSVKFQLYTVPGQVYYNATRKLVLRGVDGLVFVADSQISKKQENIESFKNLVENLDEYGYKLEDLPVVLQYNKRDLPQIMPIEEMEDSLNPQAYPRFEAVAMKGIGVFDTLKCISKLVLDKTRGKTEGKPEPVAAMTEESKDSFLEQNLASTPVELQTSSTSPAREKQISWIRTPPKTENDSEEPYLKTQPKDLENKSPEKMAEPMTPEVKRLEEKVKWTPPFKRENTLIYKPKRQAKKGFFLWRWIKKLSK